MSNKKQTAVEWLFEQLETTEFYTEESIENVYKQAKAMEKQQIELTAIKCHFEGVRQKAKTSEQYIEYGEQYYLETYEQ
jgi:predicted P-loop ATPase/GTPase